MTYAGAGLILLTPDFRVLLVQDAKTQKWGFPKGHREEYDTDDLQTAIREVLEETGIPSSSYIIQEPGFRITKGSSSYIFRYAIVHSPNSGEIQNVNEISCMQWIPIVDLLQNPDLFDGNKYFRTWISNIRTFAPRRDTQQLTKLIMALNMTIGTQSYLYI